MIRARFPFGAFEDAHLGETDARGLGDVLPGSCLAHVEECAPAPEGARVRRPSPCGGLGQCTTSPVDDEPRPSGHWAFRREGELVTESWESPLSATEARLRISLSLVQATPLLKNVRTTSEIVSAILSSDDGERDVHVAVVDHAGGSLITAYGELPQDVLQQLRVDSSARSGAEPDEPLGWTASEPPFIDDLTPEQRAIEDAELERELDQRYGTEEAPVPLNRTRASRIMTLIADAQIPRTTKSTSRRNHRKLLVGSMAAVILAVGLVAFWIFRGSTPVLHVTLTLTGGGGYTTYDPCYGTANGLVDYSDLTDSTPVRVLDAAGSIDGTALLGSGTYSADNALLDAESGGIGPYTSCTFSFHVKLDHSSTHYQLVIGSRSPYDFESTKVPLDLTLGFTHQ